MLLQEMNVSEFIARFKKDLPDCPFSDDALGAIYDFWVSADGRDAEYNPIFDVSFFAEFANYDEAERCNGGDNPYFILAELPNSVLVFES